MLTDRVLGERVALHSDLHPGRADGNKLEMREKLRGENEPKSSQDY